MMMNDTLLMGLRKATTSLPLRTPRCCGLAQTHPLSSSSAISKSTRNKKSSAHAMMKAFVAWILLLCLFCICYVRAEVEVDIAWEFNKNNNPYRSGWANATAELIDLSAQEEYGALRCKIVGYSPKLDSPNMLLEITNRHYVVMRAQYNGLATDARLLLRSGAKSSPQEQINIKTSYWTARQPMKMVRNSAAANSSHNADMVLDGNKYTFYQASQSTLVEMVFDLGDFRWVSGIRIFPKGDLESPKRCILFRSTTSGIGPFENVFMFTVQNNQSTSGGTEITEQMFQGFQGFGRYWKLLVLDNYGGARTSIREVYLEGFNEAVTTVPFALDNSGEYAMYYLPIHTYLSGTLLRMRFEFLFPDRPAGGLPNGGRGSVFNEALNIDYVRIVRAPEIYKVRGCIDKYYESANYLSPEYNVTNHFEMINTHLPIHFYTQNNLSLPYATTYDCPLSGNVTISIEGINFGSKPIVTIDSLPCPVQAVYRSEVEGRRQQILCTLPANSPGLKRVRVQHGLHPGLLFDVPSLTYRTAPPVLSRPNITNIAAYKVDLVWSPPGDAFERLTVTGYKVIYFPAKYPDFVSNMTVGNVTTTSVRGLKPGTEYVFAVAAIAEGPNTANLPTDLYGRRDHLPEGLLGEFSTYTNVTGTLLFDFNFQFFNSNQTLNNSGVDVGSNGPTGQFGSEGSYGLVMVGGANIENCNVSSTCCDGFNATIGLTSCGQYQSVCSVLPARMLASDFVINSITRRQVPSNLPYANGALPEISISTLDELIANKGANLPNSACGPALRLTPSEPRQSGSVWYRRKMNVHEGFDTTIRFKISNPSQKCDRMDDVNTYCRSRGADGWAFVIQNEQPDALGQAGSGLGYAGIFNSLAVELDTYHNYEQLDYYENHISVMTEGFRYNISSNHSRSLATTNKVPDLTDGEHTIRIRYDPSFDITAIPHPSFQVNGFTTWFLNNADFVNGGEGDWGTGFGLLYVYLDDLYSPVITTPLNLGATLHLDDGRSFVGLTSATGNDYWQAHDILSWSFSSLYIDEEYTPPLIINGEGAHQCVNSTVCVHEVDYTHYRRKNKVAPRGFGNTEGWMDGSQGFCDDC